MLLLRVLYAGEQVETKGDNISGMFENSYKYRYLNRSKKSFDCFRKLIFCKLRTLIYLTWKKMLKIYSHCYGVKVFLFFNLLLNLSLSRFSLTFFSLEVKKMHLFRIFLNIFYQQ